MADDFQVRERLLALGSTDIGLIAEHPILGNLWARRAKVKHTDLSRGSHRAVRGLKAAIVRDASSFAADLAKVWDISIDPQLNDCEETDKTVLGVRSAATLLGSAGARALVSSLAVGDFEVSTEMAQRFYELTNATDHPLSKDEQKRLADAMENHLPTEVLATLQSVPRPPAETDSEPQLAADIANTPDDYLSVQMNIAAAEAQSLIVDLRKQADALANRLLTVSEDVRAGKPALDPYEDVRAWNATVVNTWATLGGQSAAATSFDGLERLLAEIIERESAAAAESDREEKLSKLAQFQSTIASLEPMIEIDESFRVAYQVACDQAVELQAELGLADSADMSAEVNQSSRGEGRSGCTEQASNRDAYDITDIAPDKISEATSDATSEDALGEFGVRPGIDIEVAPSRPSEAYEETPTVELTAPSTDDQPSADASALSDQQDRPETNSPTEDTAESGSSTDPYLTSGGEPVQHRDRSVATADASLSNFADDLVEHAAAGRFGAAWLVAWASRLPEHEVKAYKLAAAAFQSVPGGGIDPSEILISLTTTLSDNVEFSCQSARVALAATLRAALAAGWSPRSELEVLATQANLDTSGRDLVNSVIAASDRNYQHLHDFGGGAGLSRDDVYDKAFGVRAELEGLRIKFARADKVLKYLLRASEPIGAAFEAVLAETEGEIRRDALAAALAALENAEDVIEAADSAVSTSQQRRNPIESHALRRLRRAIEETAECVTDALNSTVTVSVDSRSVVAHEVRNELMAAANFGPVVDVPGPGDAAFTHLRRWIVDPDPPDRVRSELQLLVDESLPAVSAPRDRDGLPVIDAHCAAAVVNELRSPGNWASLFDAYVMRGDLQVAEAVGRRAPELLERMATVRTDWKRRLEREVSAARADLAKTYADGAREPRANNAQVDAEAQLVIPGEYNGDRYDLQMADLARLRAALAGHRAATADHLRERVHSEVDNNSDRDRIISLVDCEDFVAANELLALARRGPLPPLSQDGTSVGSHLFAAFTAALASVQSSTDALVHDLFESFKDVRTTAVEERDETRLGNWGNLVPRGNKRSYERSGRLFAVLRDLGLDTRGEPSRQTSPGIRHFDLFRVNATPVDGSLVPGLGSQATHYMVAVTSDPKLLRETLSSGFPVKSGPNIVLFDGLLSMDQRRQCLNVCREKKISAMVIDHAVAAFVAARNPRSFRAVQQLTLPFTCFTHYTVVAGNVPDEVFVGRSDELTQLTDRTGSLFVYGGRQLGKSALLRKIQRDFNAVTDQHAIFVDLNSHGIGSWADPQQIWPVLHNELAKITSMGIKASSSVRNHDVVIKAIRHWLDGKESRRLLLLLDEADAFLEKESQGAPSGFRNIGPLKGLFDDSEGRFKPVFAGLHKVQRLQNVANTPLAHGGRDVLIGPLAAKPARDLVVKPLEALGYKFENPEAVWRLLAFTNLQPGLIQVVCNDLVTHLQSRPLRKGEPLIAISDTAIDFVTTHDTTRSKIAEKLRLTIALEDRYRVIALAVAIMSMDDSFRAKYTASDIRENSADYWPQGFQDLNSAEFEVYLDELVGLGVLTRDNESLFAVRSPNIVTMLGTREQLYTELVENIEQFTLPHEYSPQSTRRQISTGGKRVRSPLSEYELSQLIPVMKKYEARDFVIVGGESLGIGDLTSVLTQVGTERGVQVTVIDADREDVATALNEYRWAGGGTSAPRIVVVDGSQVDTARADAVVTAANSVHGRQHGHLIVVLGPGGAKTVDRCRLDWSKAKTKLIALEKWSGDGIRSRHDNPFNTPADRHDLLHHSGGWPVLVERAVAEVATANVSYAEEWDRLSKFPENALTAESFLRDVGVAKEHLPLLKAWADLGSSSYESIDDIATVLDRNVDEFRSIATNFALLGAANESQGEFLIDPVVARAVTRLA